jgi:glycosyltransferase involved in cell wall biosynthesis
MISIVTGTLNRKHLLPELLYNTILSDDRLELVLLDGGSEDGTQDYIKSLNNDRIKFIEIGERSCYAHYMNWGIKESAHEIIAQWNDDILLEASWDDVFDVIEDDIDVYKFPWIDPRENNKLTLWPSCLNFGLYRKDVFRQCGLYSTVFEYYSADSEMYSRAHTFGFRVKVCDDIIVRELNVEKVTDGNTGHNHGKYVEMCKKYKEDRELPQGVELLKD